MLEAVINVSEGRDAAVIAEVGREAAPVLLDVQSDGFHHRSVYTLAGSPDDVLTASVALSRRAVALIDLRKHEGVHPRLGVVDVVPFVPYRSPVDTALAARSRFAETLAGDGIPCFYYGPERSLPEVRRRAFREIEPDLGPLAPHRTAGACCVGMRGVLVAYNVVVDATLPRAREVARAIRSPRLRALAFPLGDEVQVSMNLLDPSVTGPAAAYDLVSGQAPVLRAELVGLVPESVLTAVPEERWGELGLSRESTVEFRLAATPGRRERA